MSKQVENPYEKVTPEEVYDGLTSINYIEKTHKEMLTSLKNTKPYKALMQIADKTYLDSNYAPLDAQTTKEKIKEVGSLILDMDFCISNSLSKIINIESKCFVETFIKRVANMKQIEAQQSTPSPKKGIKRPATKGRKETSEAKLFKRLNSESDSSVHTSDISSIDDEIIIPTENKTKDKNPKTISFKAVNQVYKTLVSKETNTSQSGKAIIPKSSTLALPANGPVVYAHKSLPKRIRKPNSKYIDKDDYSS